MTVDHAQHEMNRRALRIAMVPSLNWRQRNDSPEPKWRPAWRRAADWLAAALGIGGRG